MDSDYPSLPLSRGPPTKALPLHEPAKATSTSSEELRVPRSKKGNQRTEVRSLKNSQHVVNVISARGDVIVEYTDRDADDLPSASSTPGNRWLVASDDLMRNSPYFGAFLDPNKFSEGRRFMKQKMDWSRKTGGRETMDDGNTAMPSSSPSSLNDISLDDLPTLSLPIDGSTRKLGVDAIGLFLKVLSYHSLDDDETKQHFNAELKITPPWLIARLVEIADAFNSPQVVREALQRSGYTYGKGRVSVSKFNPSLLKMNEDRIRQIIFIAHFLGESSVYRVLTHTLLVVGSKYWVNGVEPPSSSDTTTFRWIYFTEGLEEELHYRRQCILNTITDLQAYFLRAYGALEESTGPKPTATSQTTTVPATSTTIRPKEFQCRCGFGNSNACDAFHLGQMIRFFTLRTKTVFLGSSLLDSDFDVGSDEDVDGDGIDGEDNAVRNHQPVEPAGSPPADITAIIASLKQFPDYQIDSNHTGCGVRRRIIPALDCIERFVGDGRGLLGVPLHAGTSTGNNTRFLLTATSWRSRSLRRAQTVDIRFSRISGIHYSTMYGHGYGHGNGNGETRSASQEEDARLFFTARKRHWEA